MPTVLLLLSGQGGGHNVFYVPEQSGVYVGCVLRQWIDGKEGFTSARLMELFEFDTNAVRRFEGMWPSFADLRRAALRQRIDVVEALMGTVYVYKH